MAEKDKVAAAGREDAVERADRVAEDAAEGKSVPKAGSQYAGKSFVALHAMLRDGKPVHPGKSLKFGENEDEHVADLLEKKVIVEGAESAEEVKAALEQADLARGRALTQHVVV